MSHLLGVMPRELLRLHPGDFTLQTLESKEIEAIFKACDAFWLHDGDPKKPHVVLTSGLCSNGYINCRVVLCRSNLCQIMAQQVVHLLAKHYRGQIDWVVGSDSAALGLSKDVANILGAKWHPMQKGPNKTQIWENMVIRPDEIILHVEELMTTSLTAKMVRLGIGAAHNHPINYVPYLPVLIYRPESDETAEVDNSEIICLDEYHIWASKQEECPLCQQGSERILPKGENWNRLIGK